MLDHPEVRPSPAGSLRLQGFTCGSSPLPKRREKTPNHTRASRSRGLCLSSVSLCPLAARSDLAWVRRASGCSSKGAGLLPCSLARAAEGRPQRPCWLRLGRSLSHTLVPCIAGPQPQAVRQGNSALRVCAKWVARAESKWRGDRD